MPRIIINLFVAILTFVIGTLASALFSGVSPSAEPPVKKRVVEIRESIETVYQNERTSTGCACHQESFTNDDTNETRKPINGGILNGKAISLPKPLNRPIARAAHASGTVTVQVTVDERGYVEQARAIAGHPLLQSAAVEAACQERFAPTLLSGQPVKVSGVLTYNFVPD